MNILKSIEDKIKQKYSSLEHVLVQDQSHMHHAANDSLTHLRIELVCPSFSGQPLLKRHRELQELLKNELSQIKAFSFQLITPKEWANRGNTSTPSPTCVGHKKKSDLK